MPAVSATSARGRVSPARACALRVVRRVFEHRSGFVEGFTKRYGLKRLVYFEKFETIQDAIQREHNIKHWSRAWKVRLIVTTNPEWDDLFETITK